MTGFRKRLRRETACAVRDRSRLRPLVIEIGPRAVILRPKGTRYKVEVPWDAIYDLGGKLAAEKLREIKVEARRKNKRETKRRHP